MSTRHSGIPEVVADGVSGLLVAEHDVDALADRIFRLATDPALRAEFGRAGRRRMEAGHDRRALVARLVELYARAAQPTAAGGVINRRRLT